MAIFGTFNDIPLPDIFMLVGRANGSFYITDLPSYVDYEMSFHDGAIIALYISQAPVDNVIDVGFIMVQLMRTRIGQFRYQRRAAGELVEYFRLPLEQVLISSLATADEIDALRPCFPHEKTVFVNADLSGKWMDNDLRHFYDLSHPLLISGANGETIANHIRQNLEQVMYFLYKLRIAGIIVPKREVNVATESAVNVANHRPAPSAKDAQKEDVVGYPSADLRNVRLAVPQRGFLSLIIHKIGSFIQKGTSKVQRL